MFTCRVHKGFLQGLGLGFAADKKHHRGSYKPSTGGPVASDKDDLVTQKTKEKTKEEKDKLKEFSE